MQLSQKDMRGLHIIRGLQPLNLTELTRYRLLIDISRFIKLGLVTNIVEGYALTEKGQAALRHGD